MQFGTLAQEAVVLDAWHTAVPPPVKPDWHVTVTELPAATPVYVPFVELATTRFGQNTAKAGEQGVEG